MLSYLSEVRIFIVFNRFLSHTLILTIVAIVNIPACQSQDGNIQITEKLVVTKTPTITSTPTPTPTKTSTPTQTPLPTSSATPTNTYTPLPIPTITPTPTETPIPTSTPIVCRKNTRGEFSGVWQTYKNRLGCPIQFSHNFC